MFASDWTIVRSVKKIARFTYRLKMAHECHSKNGVVATRPTSENVSKFSATKSTRSSHVREISIRRKRLVFAPCTNRTSISGRQIPALSPAPYLPNFVSRDIWLLSNVKLGRKSGRRLTASKPIRQPLSGRFQ